MTTKYIKQDCPYCSNIHTMILKANGIVKCPSCLDECKVKKHSFKIPKKRIITKKQMQELHIKFLKENLEHKKGVYEVYIKALVKYNLKNLAYAAIKADEYYQKELMKKMESLHKNGKGICSWITGNSKTTEEKIQNGIDYYDKLIDYAQNKISMMNDKAKIKIAKDAVEKGYGWLKLSSENYKQTKKKLKNDKIKNKH